MTRTKLDAVIDQFVDDTAKVAGINPAHSQPTKAMRDAKIPAGDRDEAHALFANALRRNRTALIAAATSRTVEEVEQTLSTPVTV